LNTVEFAVEGGVPYAIDFMNPAPDAEITSVGQQNFEWIVDAVAEMAVEKALGGESGRGVALGGVLEWTEVGGTDGGRAQEGLGQECL
jgi:hypothetical protein